MKEIENMPEITITSEEKNAVKNYFKALYEYVEPEYREMVLDLVRDGIPSGTKITRAGRSSCEECPEDRYLIIPLKELGKTVEIRMSITEVDDPKTHSCRWISIDLQVFQQNKYDLPEKKSETDDSSESSIDVNASTSIREGREICNAIYRNIHRVHEPDYLQRRVCHERNEERVVKQLMGTDGQKYILKRVTVLDEIYQANNVMSLAPSLYIGCFLKYNQYLIKQLDIMHDAGEVLPVFFKNNINTLTSQDRHQIVLSLLKEYLNKWGKKNIVLTDIKPYNICVKFEKNTQNPWKITFIDPSEAYCVSNGNHGLGRGSVGYYAPEFMKCYQFKTPKKWNENAIIAFSEWQEKIVDNINAYLVEQHEQQFSISTDIYALGCLLLRRFSPAPNSKLHMLLLKMCHFNKEERATLVHVEQFLDEVYTKCYARFFVRMTVHQATNSALPPIIVKNIVDSALDRAISHRRENITLPKI